MNQQVSEAESLFQHAVNRYRASLDDSISQNSAQSGIPSADSATFHVMMHGYLQLNQFQTAYSLFKQMNDLNLPLTERTFDPLVTWLAQNNQLSTALLLLDQVCESCCG
jgi:pentatricopeptide repeat protein